MTGSRQHNRWLSSVTLDVSLIHSVFVLQTWHVIIKPHLCCSFLPGLPSCKTTWTRMRTWSTGELKTPFFCFDRSIILHVSMMTMMLFKCQAGSNFLKELKSNSKLVLFPKLYLKMFITIPQFVSRLLPLHLILKAHLCFIHPYWRFRFMLLLFYYIFFVTFYS